MATTTKTMNHTEYQKWCKDQTNAVLSHVIKDAGEAIAAMPDNPNAGYYADEIHYCNMELDYRRKSAYLTPYKYEVEGYNRKHHVNEFKGDVGQRNIIGGLTKKLATSIAYYMNQAYKLGVENGINKQKIGRIL